MRTTVNIETIKFSFIFFEIQPLPLPSPKERVIGPRVDEFLF